MNIMEIPRRVTLAFCLILTLCTLAAAQEPKVGKDDKPPKHKGHIEKEYNETQDQTTLSLGTMPVTCVRDGCMFISLRTSYEGKAIKASSDRFVFGLIIMTKTLEPFEAPQLVALIDGEQVELGTMTYAGSQSKDGLVGIAYGLILDHKTLAKVAHAREVEMGIGSLRFKLIKDNLNAMLDLLNQATLK